MRALVVALALLLGGPALAQPMMVDPAKMSGIPRPDPAVPAGTITVRLIRGELANRMVGHEVELHDAKGEVKKAKTDDEGRATFSGLEGGPFRARAKDKEGVELASESITLPPAVGVRVMLVFPKGGLGSADGQGRADKTLPAGTLVVKAQDGEDKPLPGLEVVVVQGRAGEQEVKEHKGKTDDQGEARFDGLDQKPTSGYLAEVVKDGVRHAGKPFRLLGNMGSRVVIEVRPVSRDLRVLQIGQNSHFIFEVQDDAIQVMEVLRLQNLGSETVEVPGGIHLPLPSVALSAATGPQSPPQLSVSGHEAVWKGPLPPGDVMLQIAYVVAIKGDSVTLEQPTPIPFSEVNVVSEDIPGMTVSGHDVVAEGRELQGRKLKLYRGKGTPMNGRLSLTLSGLPRSDPTWRRATAGLAALIVVVMLGWAFRGPAAGASRLKLEAERDRLLDALAKLEGGGAKDKKKRDELIGKLTRVYRELDQV